MRAFFSSLALLLLQLPCLGAALLASGASPSPSVAGTSAEAPWMAILQDGQEGDQDADDPEAQTEDDSNPDEPGSPSAGIDHSSWVWWWQLNREPFLDLRAQLGLHDPNRAALPGLTPTLAGVKPSQGRRPDSKLIHAEILPALFDALEARSSRDVISACLIALARVGEDQSGEDRAQVLGRIRPLLQHGDQQVVEAAITALGILGNESASGLLSELLLDTPYGQKLVSDSKVPQRARAFAAYAIGLLGARTQKEDVRRYAVYMLARALEKDKSSTPDIGVACVRAIGMTPLNWSGSIPSDGATLADPPGASREAQLQFLMQILAENRRHRQVMASLPGALVQLLNADEAASKGEMQRRVGTALLEQFNSDRRTDRELRRSCAMALGLLGSTGDESLDRGIVTALSMRDRDRITRNWSLMSLGRLGGEQPAIGAEVRRKLLLILDQKNGEEAEWAALGLALLERRVLAPKLGAETAQAVLKRLTKSTRLGEVGAFSLALGLIGDPLAREGLGKKLMRVEEPGTRGYLALALAMLGATDQISPIETIMIKAESQPLLLQDCATALALLGDTTIVKRLVDMLNTSHSSSAQSGLAQALGRVGDSTCVPALLAMLGDETATEHRRAFAAIALGLVADRDRLPWNTLISLNTNHSAAPPTLMDSEGHGILNLR